MRARSPSIWLLSNHSNARWRLYPFYYSTSIEFLSSTKTPPTVVHHILHHESGNNNRFQFLPTCLRGTHSIPMSAVRLVCFLPRIAFMNNRVQYPCSYL